jgi:serine/threonine protein kinase
MTLSGGLARWYVDIADYDVGEDLGAGAFGSVKLGIRRSDGLKVAIKRLPPFVGKVDQQNFVREITIPARLQDPAILPLIGFSLQDDEGSIIVTKFIANGSLDGLNHRRVIGRPFPRSFTPINLTIIFYGIAHALGVLHKNMIFHRDLKPPNVLLGDTYEPYLADFGLSRAASGLRMTANIGSPLYMAPELWEGLGQYDAKVDIYAFGVTMYFSLTADPSFLFDDGVMVSSVDVLERKVREGCRLARKPDINDAYWTLITWCWVNAAGDRPSAEELCEELEKPEYLLEPEKEGKFREYVQILKQSGKPQPENKARTGSQFVFQRRSV